MRTRRLLFGLATSALAIACEPASSTSTVVADPPYTGNGTPSSDPFVPSESTGPTDPEGTPTEGDPAATEPGDPADPGETDPGDPGAPDPTDPGEEDPTDPGATDPTDPGEVDPDEDPGTPVDPGPVDDPTDPAEVPVEQTQDQLSPEDQAKVDTLRDAIFNGLDIGRTHFADTIDGVLLENDVPADNIDDGLSEDAGLSEPLVDCPFVTYAANYASQGATCDYLVDLAKVDAYAKLSAALDEAPADNELNSAFPEEALFWREQGAQSGIEELRVELRAAMLAVQSCNAQPTPTESAAVKGNLVGRKLFAERMNHWLTSKGHTADYPTMSKPINVCNLNQSLLDPVRKDAYDRVDVAIDANPLCEGYNAPTLDEQNQFAQAEIDFATQVQAGIGDEYSIAAVKVFRVVPCAVSDPLVVDLDGDGIEILPIERGVNFDLWSNEHAVAVAWPHPDDAFLVLDVDADGSVVNGSELLGDIDGHSANGFDKLASLDHISAGGDGDGHITSRDAAYQRLRVWQDRDTNGRVSDGELLGLDTVGLESIPTRAAASTLQAGGCNIAEATHATTATGSMLVGDVYLRTAPWPRLSAAR